MEAWLVALCARSIPLVRAGEAGGLGAVAGLDLGAAAGPALAAVSGAFLDGMRLCLGVSAVLLVIAVAAAVLLRRPRRSREPSAAPAAERLPAG
ncbi:hypothetical protein AB0K67_25990 [Nonomuraea sp. NPDC052634]|uniref:hypothetical protein n=1 Tax=Nonomuraea sp. NPDC052634 TaxID=3155813 RepID=UPI003438FE82